MRIKTNFALSQRQWRNLEGRVTRSLLLISLEAESDLENLVIEMSQQVQMGMENMLKLVNEVDQSSVGIK
ncbi:unnamed protein product [Cochlearia groenlandica]